VFWRWVGAAGRPVEVVHGVGRVTGKGRREPVLWQAIATLGPLDATRVLAAIATVVHCLAVSRGVLVVSVVGVGGGRGAAVAVDVRGGDLADEVQLLGEPRLVVTGQKELLQHTMRGGEGLGLVRSYYIS
jgi:hypothetical protein